MQFQLRELSEIGSQQRAVFNRLIKGRPEKEIATELSISAHTVHSHIKQLYRRLHVNSRPELMAVLLERLRRKFAPDQDPSQPIEL